VDVIEFATLALQFPAQRPVIGTCVLELVARFLIGLFETLPVTVVIAQASPRMKPKAAESRDLTAPLDVLCSLFRPDGKCADGSGMPDDPCPVPTRAQTLCPAGFGRATQW
jgi:hypothetical protein